jgi:hypothetical protein
LAYWDFIGNISSSTANRGENSVDLKIEPRFPIFGQWKTDWNQSYNILTRYHLYQDVNKPEKFLFNFTFLHNYEDIVAENYTL